MKKKTPKYAILITAYKEVSVTLLMETICTPEYNNLPQDLEIYLSAPDSKTRNLAKRVAIKYKIESKFHLLKDPGKGKPTALNLAMQQIDAQWLICTDGDVYLEPNSIPYLLQNIEKKNDSKIGAISARPISVDSKNNFWGYIGNLLADAAHDRRHTNAQNNKPYFVSGYLVAYRKSLLKLLVPKTLVDDAQYSMQILDQGFDIRYESKSKVCIKYPQNLKDWIGQKRRSVGGYREIQNQYPELLSQIQNRNLKSELAYLFFPLHYANNFKHFFFSLGLYPLRIYLWTIIYFDSKSKKEGLWVRIDSTK